MANEKIETVIEEKLLEALENPEMSEDQVRTLELKVQTVRKLAT